MFDMDLPVWELVLRATVVYFVLLVMIRLSGKRTVAGLILASTLIVINLGIAFASARSEKIESLIQGRPLLIGSKGEVFKDRLQAQHISMSDVEQALREANCEMQDMRYAFLEADGKISILKKSG